MYILEGLLWVMISTIQIFGRLAKRRSTLVFIESQRLNTVVDLAVVSSMVVCVEV